MQNIVVRDKLDFSPRSQFPSLGFFLSRAALLNTFQKIAAFLYTSPLFFVLKPDRSAPTMSNLGSKESTYSVSFKLVDNTVAEGSGLCSIALASVTTKSRSERKSPFGPSVLVASARLTAPARLPRPSALIQAWA